MRRLGLVQPSAVRRALRCAAIALLALPLASGATAAQARSEAAGHALVGSVRTGDDSRLAGARVQLLSDDPARQRVLLTGDDGAFRFDRVRVGTALLQVRRLGFRPETLAVEVPQVAGGAIVVALEQVAQPMRPLLVREERRDGPFAAFNHRRTAGFGRFITRADVEKRRPMRTTDLLRTVPGLTIERGPGGEAIARFRNAGYGMRQTPCQPTYWLDGMPLAGGTFDVDALAPDAIEGVELYSGAATVPPALRAGSQATGACGVIAIWMRQGVRPRHPEALVASDSLEALVVAGRAYMADQVEMPASPLPGGLDAPAYPDSLRAARVVGRVVVEFIVSERGEVEPETIGVVSSAHPLFAESVRQAIVSGRFTPAQKGGRAVRQIVQLPVLFSPEAPAVAPTTGSAP